MNVNLKEITLCRENLEFALQKKNEILTTGIKPTLLKKIVKLLEEIETDLELAGESIVELDKPRLEAIEERNKMLAFKKYGYGE
jgi:hypothetical protein